MITEDYVSFETAKILKTKGFDEYCGYYDKAGEYWGYCTYNHKCDDYISAPTYQMAMKWLREIHKLHIDIVLQQDAEVDASDFICMYTFNVSRMNRCANEGGDCKFYKSYEEAAEAAIKYCLENLI